MDHLTGLSLDNCDITDAGIASWNVCRWTI
jgi:hypothetical protein